MQTNIENFYRSVSQNPALLSKITTGATTPDEFIDRAIVVARDEGYAIDRAEAKSWIDVAGVNYLVRRIDSSELLPELTCCLT